MQTRSIVLVPFVLIVLASCVQMEHQSSVDMNPTVQSPKTIVDHEALARRYENAAKIMLVKIQEQKVLVEKYDEESNRYGQEAEKGIFNTHRLRGDDENYFFAKRAEDNKLKSQALIRSYEKEVEENMSRAALHWKLVTESK
jgi:hypothetical protein